MFVPTGTAEMELKQASCVWRCSEVVSIPSAAWRPCSARGAHGFASPPYDGFALVEDEEVKSKSSVPNAAWCWAWVRLPRASLKPLHEQKLGREKWAVKSATEFSAQSAL